MSKKPFKVSARTARLIGRENVSNADGAVIELVKNCYDADSPISILFFDIKYESVPESISTNDYLKIVSGSTTKEILLFEKAYSLSKEEKSYKLREKLSISLSSKIENYFKNKNKLYIIDSGEGMTEEIIDKYWMTIGTDNKLTDILTPSGRIKAGAKGIGRFALDRLGSTCKMITSPKGKTTGYEWKVNWEEFEKEGASINDINADFDIKTNLDYKKEILKIVDNARVKKTINYHDKLFKSGTTLVIGDLRDWWNYNDVENLYESLQILSPPTTRQEFNIELFSEKYSEAFGRVDNKGFSDYDYRIHAVIAKDKTVKITIHREEFQTNKIDKDLFRRSQMKNPPYDLNTFRKGWYTIDTSVDELLPWLSESSIAVEADNLKEFDFEFYFMKLSSNERDKDRFFYKNFSRAERVDWFTKFGGIKVFRDNFRVRPYGEPGNTSFDWLLLGDRQAKSPAGITKKGGGWRVAPNQVAGAINISRLANLKFEDKSSREGFQENNTFYVFQQLLLSIISQFEFDRHIVMREMDLLYREKNEEEEAKNQAELLLKDDKGDSGKEENANSSNKDDEHFKEERETFKKAYSAVRANLEDAEEEVRILSALATTGLIVTSFAHEFSSFKIKLVRNTNALFNGLNKLLDKKKLDASLLNRQNPFNLIENLKRAHDGITQWLDLSLTAIKKDKRSAKAINIEDYLNEFLEIWKDILITRKTQLKIDSSTQDALRIRAFTIDIDSIFNNLLINSFDAFDRKGFTGKRLINIEINLNYDDEEKRDYLEIAYADSGPGLAKKIRNPYQILKRGYTTKVNEKNIEVGTGLGMWIINEAVTYYGGTIEIMKPLSGFKLKIKLPYNKKY